MPTESPTVRRIRPTASNSVRQHLRLTTSASESIREAPRGSERLRAIEGADGSRQSRASEVRAGLTFAAKHAPCQLFEQVGRRCTIV